jgi:hypothetical protein
MPSMSSMGSQFLIERTYCYTIQYHNVELVSFMPRSEMSSCVNFWVPALGSSALN